MTKTLFLVRFVGLLERWVFGAVGRRSCSNRCDIHRASGREREHLVGDKTVATIQATSLNREVGKDRGICSRFISRSEKKDLATDEIIEDIGSGMNYKKEGVLKTDESSACRKHCSSRHLRNPRR